MNIEDPIPTKSCMPKNCARIFWPALKTRTRNTKNAAVNAVSKTTITTTVAVEMTMEVSLEGVMVEVGETVPTQLVMDMVNINPQPLRPIQRQPLLQARAKQAQTLRIMPHSMHNTTRMVRILTPLTAATKHTCKCTISTTISNSRRQV